MASDSEDEILEDVDAICGWGTADFDDELATRACRNTVGKVNVKRKHQNALSHSNNPTETQYPIDSRLSQDKPIEKPVEYPIKQPRKVEGLPKDHRQHRKTKPKQPREAKMQKSPKPLPRTVSLKEGHAAIAASGRERRIRIVAAAMASNVARKPCIASVVLASFDDDSDEEQEGQKMMSRGSKEERTPSSAPQNQLQIKPLRVQEASTAPAGPIKNPKKINPPLPLLSIKPDCGGNETRLFGKGAPPHYGRRREQKSSLLASRDVSDNWESNFPPALRRSRSPRRYQAEPPQASNSSPSSFTKPDRAPLAPRQEYPARPHLKELLPLIHHTDKESDLPAGVIKVSNISAATANNAPVARTDENEAEDDGESWAECNDDPEVLAKNMAGLIQALSTFAADGKATKASKGGKNKKETCEASASATTFPPNPPVLRLPPPGEINVTSSRAAITEVQQASKHARRRKHRKFRSKLSDSTMTAGVSRENNLIPKGRLLWRSPLCTVPVTAFFCLAFSCWDHFSICSCWDSVVTEAAVDMGHCPIDGCCKSGFICNGMS